MKKFLYAAAMVAAITIVACSGRDGRLVVEQSRDNIADVSSEVEEFVPGGFISGPSSLLSVWKDRILISDLNCYDSIVAVVDPETRKEIGRIVKQGPGPDEILIPGDMFITSTGKLGIFDYGQRKVALYDVDSALADRKYSPQKMTILNQMTFPSHFAYLSDTVSYGRYIALGENGGNDYVQTVCKYSLTNGDIGEFGSFEHGGGDRSMVGVAPDGSIIVEDFTNRDLTVIYDKEGNVVREIHGPDYDKATDDNRRWGSRVCITPDNILLANSRGCERSTFPYGRWIDVRSLDGTYLQTLDLGLEIFYMVYDSASGYLYLSTRDEPQFVRLNLKALLNGEKINAMKPAAISTANEDGSTGDVIKKEIPPIDFLEPGKTHENLDLGEVSISEESSKFMCMKNLGTDTLRFEKIVPSKPSIKVEPSLDHLQPEMTIFFQTIIPAGTLSAGKIGEWIDFYFEGYEKPRRFPIIGTAK